MGFGDALTEILQEKGVTQSELARRSGVSRMTINALIKGRANNPTLAMAKKMADALDTTLDELAERAYR